MITLGSIAREEATLRFPFLALRYRGRRAAIREWTHRDPDFVFWIAPDGRLHNARDSHRPDVDEEGSTRGLLRGAPAARAKSA